MGVLLPFLLLFYTKFVIQKSRTVDITKNKIQQARAKHTKLKTKKI